MNDPVARRIVLVTGLSGAGKSSILRTLEDIGFAAVDNLPLALIGDLVAQEHGALAIGVDARTRDFSAAALLALIGGLRACPGVQPELVFATAAEDALLRRYTETRRRHPLALTGRVTDGIAAEAAMMTGLREAADLLVDTTELPSPLLRQLIEARFGGGGPAVSLISFAYPRGLPREADLVFDARFLRNPHYVPALRGLTGLDQEVASFIDQDPFCRAFFDRLLDLALLLLPRFVLEGKRYVTIGIGCTGGRHRSVHLVELLAAGLTSAGWHTGRTHRELGAGAAASPLSAASGSGVPKSVEA